MYLSSGFLLFSIRADSLSHRKFRHNLGISFLLTSFGTRHCFHIKFQSLLPAVPYFLIVIADDFHGIQFSAGVLSIDNPKAASVVPMHMDCTCVIHLCNSSLAQLMEAYFYRLKIKTTPKTVHLAKYVRELL